MDGSQAVAVVTGASKGIGLAVVEALVRDGFAVVGGARTSSPRLDELVAGGAVRFAAVDLAAPEGATRLAEAAGERVDVLVNNVGAVHPRTEGFLAIDDDAWAATLNLTLLAAVRTTRAVLPRMLAAGRGAIVNVVSVNASLPDPGVLDYSAAKAALASFGKALSKEVGPSGIRVNSVDPGPVATDLWLGSGGVADTLAGAGGGRPEDIAAAAVAGTATGRFTQPAEVAEIVAFLAGGRPDPDALRRRGSGERAEGVAEPGPGADPELREGAVEVGSDRARGEVQALADLAVRQPGRGEGDDLPLLRREHLRAPGVDGTE
jgi:NAD(P)-dependent dehydrogenase (short-subunit alcohol dehydrogenase family)